MAAVEDVLATRLDLLGLSGYVGGFDQATAAIGLHDAALSAAQTRALAFGAAAGAVGAAGLAFFGRAALAAGEDAAVFGRAAANFKGGFPAGEIAEFTGELERATGVADDSVAAFLGLLGTYQLTGDQAKALAEPILNATEALKASGATTEQIANAVGKALQLNEPSRLIRANIAIDEAAFKSADAAGKVKLLADALNAQGGATAARDALNTLPGAIAGATTAFGSLQEALGAPLVGPLKTAADLARGAANAFTALPGPLQTTITLVGVGLSGALLIYSAQTVIAVAQTVRLARAQLEAAAAAKTMAAANSQAGTAAVVNSGAGGGAGARFAQGAKVAAGVGVADLVAQLIPDDAFGGAGAGAKNILNGAAAGAALGSPGGVRGAAVGALLGGGAAAVSNLMNGGKDKQQTELEKQTEILKGIKDNTDPSKAPLGSSDMAVRRQLGALDARRFLVG